MVEVPPTGGLRDSHDEKVCPLFSLCQEVRDALCFFLNARGSDGPKVVGPAVIQMVHICLVHLTSKVLFW